MRRMLRAKALARTEGCVTLARMVLVGPVLKNRQKTAKNMNIQAKGKSVHKKPRTMGKPTSMAGTENRKKEPGKRGPNQSPHKTRENMCTRPATASNHPKKDAGCNAR